MQDLFEVFGEPISVYSREQAFEDGVLANLTEIAPDVCAQHYPGVSVACTSAVWDIIEKAVANKRHCNDFNGVIHDMLWMSRMFKRVVTESVVIFRVTIKGAGRKSVYDFRAVLDGDGLTIMNIEED